MNYLILASGGAATVEKRAAVKALFALPVNRIAQWDRYFSIGYMRLGLRLSPQINMNII
ncbi:hypothetical protein GX408_08345 [bacterium]|nr:hypothetical protein [bacterium]